MNSVVLIYLILFVISFLLFLYMIGAERSHTEYQTLGVMMIIIANGGYLAFSLAQDLSEALLANKLIYVGGCFIPLTFFLIISEICKLKIPQPVYALMFVPQVILYACVCTMGRTGLYYSQVVYHNENGLVYLVKEYGPAHMFYPITMYGYMGAAVVIAVVTLIRRKNVSRRDIVIIIAGYVITCVGFLIERMMKIKFDVMPMMYVVFETIILFPLHRLNGYSVREENMTFLGQKSVEGIFTMNRKQCYMSSNQALRSMFPEIDSYSVDKPFPKDGSIFADVMIPRIAGSIATMTDIGDYTDSLSIGDKSYEYVISKIRGLGRIHIGYSVKILDTSERQEYLNTIDRYNKRLESEVKGKTARIREIQEKTLLGMAQMVESRDLSTGGHIKRTSQVVSIFSRALLKANLGFTEEFLGFVERSAPMHDLGKIAVDDQILRKQGKFTDEEYNEMKKHSAEGAKIVSSILTGIEQEDFVNIATNVAHYHHEKVNGLGYPDGLKGEEIPVEARIMALADVFDALVSKRCYKEAFTFDKAFEIIEKDSGSHFDPALARVFLGCRNELEMLYMSLEEE